MPTGNCLRADFAFEIDGPADTVGHCHCSMCRKYHGSAFARDSARHVAARTFGGCAGRSERGFRTHMIPVLQQPAKNRTAIPTGFLQ